MKLTSLQWFVVGCTALLITLLAFVFDTRPPDHRALEKSRALMAEAADAGLLIRDATAQLDAARRAQVTQLELAVEQAGSDSLRAIQLEELASLWYELGRADISGIYAERIADLRNDAPSWALAGTTYMLCIQQRQEERIRRFCRDRALQAFEYALSLDPQDLNSRINRALVYVEMPPEGKPMEGIQMLLSLNEQYPDQPAVLLQLARLAIRTGQYERAVQRLKRVLEIAPDEQRAHCLMAEALTQMNRTTEAEAHAARCAQDN